MPRPRSAPRSGEAVLSNSELARIFNEIADMLEILGEVVYKAVAYRRVADAVERWPEDVAARYRSAEPPHIPGAGAALSARIEINATAAQIPVRCGGGTTTGEDSASTASFTDAMKR